jgi:thiamine pyrophosphate-dependent acetolactate synthase large subunit-like protein
MAWVPSKESVMNSTKTRVNRRGFLKGAAAAGAAASAATIVGPAAAQAQQPAAAARGTAPPPSAAAIAAETEPLAPERVAMTVDDAGSDFMVDVFKSLGFDYIASNPGSSFRGLQESFIAYGQNRSPEWLTCCHEETSVALADGYYRVTGRPMLAMAHGTVGLQHAAMTIYNAFVARNPVFIVLGNALDAVGRRPGVEWNHSVQDASAMVRDYIKWDDTPVSLQHFAESAVRAYKISMTVPRGPVILVADGDLQEHAVGNRAKLHIPKLTLTRPPAGDPAAVAELAKALVEAENPVILAGRVTRDEQGLAAMIELAETLQAPVLAGRDLPNRHPLNGGGSIANADVILGLQQDDLWGATHEYRDQQERTWRPLTRPGARVFSVNANDLYMKSNYQDFQRFAEVEMAIAADAEATLPSLVEACRRLITADRRRALDERGRRIAAANAQAVERARIQAAFAWDASPISTTRLSMELYEAIRTKDWALVRGNPHRLWNVDKYYRTLSGGGAAALGSGLPMAVGAALGHRPHGRLAVALQTDGDLMYAPGALWTATHHRIPMLFVMLNNRAYHQEVMHIQRMNNRRQRAVTVGSEGVGTLITDPNIDYAMLGRSMGLYAEGAITNPNELGPALRRAIERVERGETALVDVVTQPR